MTRLEGDEAILGAACGSSLRLVGQNNLWVPAPRNPRALAVSGRDVRRLVAEGKLTFLKRGHRRRFRPTVVVLADPTSRRPS
jgi:hypothetical protein